MPSDNAGESPEAPRACYTASNAMRAGDSHNSPPLTRTQTPTNASAGDRSDTPTTPAVDVLTSYKDNNGLTIWSNITPENLKKTSLGVLEELCTAVNLAGAPAFMPTPALYLMHYKKQIVYWTSLLNNAIDAKRKERNPFMSDDQKEYLPWVLYNIKQGHMVLLREVMRYKILRNGAFALDSLRAAIAEATEDHINDESVKSEAHGYMDKISGYHNLREEHGDDYNIMFHMCVRHSACMM